MKRTPAINSAAPGAAKVQPSAQHAELALREARSLMAPLALWLLRNGVSYPAFAELLKSVFVAAAQSELERTTSAPTQSALSLLSGVHRKDVRQMTQAVEPGEGRGRPPLSSQVFTRWLADARYRSKDGTPRALPRTGTRRSFESLCRELSNDVHPRAVLDELLRLGLVELDGDLVVARATSFVPSQRLDEMTALFSSNVADHIAAAVDNLTLKGAPFLEQSVYADGLGPESIRLLHEAARKAWAQAFDAVVSTARERVDADMQGDGHLRMRFGTYFFSEPATTAAPAASPPSRRPRRPKSRS